MPPTTPSFAILRSAELEVAIDVAHGAEVVTLRERGGEELLGRTPWEPQAPCDEELDEDAWTRGYRGGWQLLTPNAGDACELDGELHGFHGRASHAPWEALATAGDALVARWRGHGLTVTRSYRLDGDELSATTSWSADERAVPIVHVEHVAVGRALLDPAVELRLPGGSAERLSYAHERASFAVVTGFTEGVAELVNVASGLALRIEWDAAQLPFAWIWHELRASDGTWDRRTELLGFEPASTGQPHGLREAVERDEATWVEPGRPLQRRIALRVVREAAAR